MNWIKEEFNVDGKNCIAYMWGKPGYLLLQPVDEHDIEALDEEMEILSAKADEGILLVAFQAENWNDELSPWAMAAVFGKEGFGGSAGETLLFLEKKLLPQVREKYRLDDNVRIILGGIFAGRAVQPVERLSDENLRCHCCSLPICVVRRLGSIRRRTQAYDRYHLSQSGRQRGKNKEPDNEACGGFYQGSVRNPERAEYYIHVGMECRRPFSGFREKNCKGFSVVHRS